MAAGLPKFMKNKFLLLILVVVVIASLEAVAMLSKPKVVLKEASVKDSSLRSVPVVVERELSSFVSQESAIEEKREASPIFNLELIGTAMGNSKDPVAFIKDMESGKQGIYKQGSMIKEAKVVKIAMGEVTLDVNGEEKLIRLTRRTGLSASDSTETQAIISIAQDSYLVNRREMMRDGFNVLALAKDIKIKPYYESQKVAGLKVEGIPQNSLFALAGLHDSDVVTMVNAQKIDSYQKALQVLNKMKGQSAVQVSVLRNGETKMLSYKLQ